MMLRHGILLIMHSTSSPMLVYLNAQGQGVVTCPLCSLQSQVSGAIYCDLHAPLTVTCACGHRLLILFNTRHYYRKAVRLSGTYTSPSDPTRRQMTVLNLSLTGAHLRTLLPHMLHVDDVIDLAFCLEDRQHTEIHAQAIVRWVEDKQLGAEFRDPQACERELGFYLRPT